MNLRFGPWLVGCLSAAALVVGADRNALADEPKAEALPQLPPSNTAADPEAKDTFEEPPPPPEPATEELPAPPPTSYEVEEDDSIPAEQLETKMASPFLFGVGLVVGGAGFIALLAGTGLRYGGGDATCPECELTSDQTTGLLMMIGGGTLAITGGLMMVYGARPEPDKPAWAKAIPAVGVGPGNIRMRWTF